MPDGQVLRLLRNSDAHAQVTDRLFASPLIGGKFYPLDLPTVAAATGRGVLSGSSDASLSWEWLQILDGNGTGTSLSITLPNPRSIRLFVRVTNVPSTQAISLTFDGLSTAYYGERYGIRDGVADALVDDNNAASFTNVYQNRAASNNATLVIEAFVNGGAIGVIVSGAGVRSMSRYSGQCGSSISNVLSSLALTWGGNSLSYTYSGLMGA